MKIISYNISQYIQDKVDKILLFDADIFILPEMACPSMVQLPDGYEMVWTGNIDYKGLGVIWKSYLKADVPTWFNPNLNYFLPLIIEGNLILASWPTVTEQNKPKSYPRIMMEALEEYTPYLREYPSLITGDMNCYKGQSGETKRFSIQSIFDYLQGLGYVSAYHQKSGEILGNESAATYFHLFKENSPFFIDYAFTNIPIKEYRLLPWDRELSDHVGQMIVIESYS